MNVKWKTQTSLSIGKILLSTPPSTFITKAEIRIRFKKKLSILKVEFEIMLELFLIFL